MQTKRLTGPISFFELIFERNTARSNNILIDHLWSRHKNIAKCQVWVSSDEPDSEDLSSILRQLPTPMFEFSINLEEQEPEAEISVIQKDFLYQLISEPYLEKMYNTYISFLTSHFNLEEVEVN